MRVFLYMLTCLQGGHVNSGSERLGDLPKAIKQGARQSED